MSNQDENLTFDSIIEWAASWVPDDPPGQRARFAEAMRDELTRHDAAAIRATREELRLARRDVAQALAEYGLADQAYRAAIDDLGAAPTVRELSAFDLAVRTLERCRSERDDAAACLARVVRELGAPPADEGSECTGCIETECDECGALRLLREDDCPVHGREDDA